MSLRKKVVNGVLWTSISNIAGFGVNFFLGIWLARLLGPGAYGLVGMILVITGFARLLLDFGFGEALIQNQHVDQNDYSTIFWLNVFISIVLTGIVYFSAPLIASFYHNQELIPLCKALSWTFILNGLAIIQRIKLEKAYRFKALGIAEVSSSILSISVALVLAFRNYGVWSLVALHLVKPLCYNIVVWISSNWAPSLRFNTQSIQKLSKFSFALFLNGLIGTLSINLDKLLIGRTFGDINLGIYSKSFSTVRMPVNQIMSALGRVIFPAFSQIQDNHEKIFDVYKKIVVLISSLIFPIMVSFFVFSDELILGLFGVKWIKMIPIFKILALTVGFIPFNILADSVVKSQGRVDLLNYITFIEKPLVMIAVVIGIIMGSIETVAMAFAVNIVIVFFIKSLIVSKALGKRFWPLLKCHAGAMRIIVLPIVALFGLSYFADMNGIVAKIWILALSLSVSIFLLKKSLITPMLEFIADYRKGSRSS